MHLRAHPHHAYGANATFARLFLAFLHGVDMALGLEIAVVLRAKGGVNFLMHTRGVGAKDATEATRQAVDTLTQFAETGGKGDVDGSGDNSPGFAAGQLLVCRGRHLVSYRLVNAIWVMTVTGADPNTLLCKQVVDTVAHLLVAACKGVEVTPDKIARRYPEVYLATGQVLAPGGLSSDAGRMLTVAEAEVAGIAPETGAKAKGPTATIKSRLGVGSRKGMGSSPSASSLHSPSTDVSVASARLAAEGETTGITPFVLPPDALTPQLPNPNAAPAASVAADAALDDLFGPPLLSPPLASGAEFLAGTGLETLEEPPADYDRRFSNLRPPPAPPAVSDNPWADFEASAPSGPANASRDPFLAEAARAPKPELPPPTTKQQKAIANGNALQLVEVWKALFVGPELNTAGTFGEVVGTGSVPKVAASAALKLSAEEEGEGMHKCVAAVAKAARGLPGVTSENQEEMVAHFGEVPGAQAPFVRYRLASTAVHPPLLMAVSVGTRRGTKPKALPEQPLAADAGPADEAETDATAPGQDELPALSRPNGEAAHDELTAQSDRPVGAETAFNERAQEGEEHLLAVKIAVDPGLGGPLRGACLDLDVHHSLGHPMAVSGQAQWSARQRRLRWRLFTLEPGTKVQMSALFKSRGEVELPAACANTLASLHAFGPPGQALSTIGLLSGTVGGDLKASRRAFHCEVYAKPEAPRQRGESSKLGLLSRAIQILEEQKLKEEKAGVAKAEDPRFALS